MREHEVPVCSEAGQLPDAAATGEGSPITDYTAPAATTVNLTYTTVMQKGLVANEGNNDVFVKLGSHGCDTSNYTRKLAPGDSIEWGVTRPHLFTKLSIYCSAAGVWYGAGKNLTIEAWR